MSDYSKSDAVSALQSVGVGPGSVLFSHSNIGFFGKASGAKSSEDLCAQILAAIFEVIGESGTLVVPTFTYSFCRRQVFNIETTPSTCGAFTEFVRKQPGAQRSRDPIFSVAALGRQARLLTHDVSEECFGGGSFWERFLKAKGLVCNLNLDAGSTFLHFVEKQLGAPYRYDKLFSGTFVSAGISHRGKAIFFCQDLSNPETVAAFEPFHTFASVQGLTQSAKLGRGQILTIGAEASYNLIKETFRTKPYFLTAAGSKGIVPRIKRTGTVTPVYLPPNATMVEKIRCLSSLRCNIMSDGYDSALAALADQMPMTLCEFDTGYRSWNQLIPEKWTCHEAFLERTNGEKLFSYRDNPMHVASYSTPFSGEISRETLFNHLHTAPDDPESIPYVSKYSESDWALCCSEAFRESLTDARYRVTIHSEFSYGTLKIGESTVPGASAETIVICGQLWHPSPSHDELSGVLVGMEVMERLRKKSNLRYSYRLLILPPTFGYAACLSRHKDKLAAIKGGLFIHAVGLPNPPALELSFGGNTEIDRSFSASFRKTDPTAQIGAHGAILGDHDHQFNLPDVNIPIVCLTRLPLNSAVPTLSPTHLQETTDLVLRMIEGLETHVDEGTPSSFR